MPLMAQCFPWWHKVFERFEGIAWVPLCSVDENPESPTYGFVPCPVEKLRAHAEKILNGLGIWKGKLPLAVYLLARNVKSEIGNGTVEEKMTIALTTKNEAKRRGKSVEDLILLNGGARGSDGACRTRLSAQEPISCRLPFVGKINDPVRGSVFGRFTSSSKEPDAEAIMIAAFALRGDAGVSPNDFVRGGNDQAASFIINPKDSARRKKQYWVGALPGVNARHVMIMRTRPDLDPTSQLAQNLIGQAEAMCGAPQGGLCARGGSGLPPDPPCVERLPLLQQKGSARTAIAIVGLGLTGALAGIIVAAVNRA